MVDLIVTEKPSVAKDLARIMKVRGREDGYFRSDRFWITWCFGHMAQLAQPQAYDEGWKSWRRETLPMIPDTFELEPRDSARDQLRVLRRLMNHDDVSSIINACDAGREGELIFRYVYELSSASKATQRLWLASLTDDAVRQAYRTMKPGTEYDALGDAARCRSEADWLVGLNATRAMTLMSRRAGSSAVMSIGRVQTPTLAMLVGRELEIEAFVPEPFWQVYATFDAAPQDEGIPTTYQGLWTRRGKDRFTEKEKAEEVLAAIAEGAGTVTKLVQKDVREKPPLLFDLTTLQRQANTRFGLSAQDTLSIAQALYEKHKILTYPRTDSNHLTTDMEAGLPDAVRAVNFGPYAPFCDHLLASLPLPTSRRIINDKEVGDHHAIIPTTRAPNTSALSIDEKRIYDMVVRRFLAAFYPDAIFATTRIETTVLEEHLFVTKGKARRVAGWQEVEPPRRSAKKRKGAPETLPTVTRDQEFPIEKTRLYEGSTKPPNRFTESSLLGSMERAGKSLEDAEMRRAMKESGLGTPATRASIIETLLKREFIERQGKSLVPTARGRVLVTSLGVEALKSPELTGDWEAKLSQVADGRLERGVFMQEVRTLTREVTDAILSQEIELPEEAITDEILGTCPICSTHVTEGPKAYSCRMGRDCSFVVFKKVAKRSISKTIVKTLLSGQPTQVLKGFKSKKGTDFEAALKLNDEGRVVFDFDPRPAAPTRQRTPEAPAPQTPTPQAPEPSTAESTTPRSAPTAAAPAATPAAPEGARTCPKCGQGHLLEGKRGWGCSRWRDGCNFVVWFEVFGKKLTAAQSRDLFEKGKTRKVAGWTHGEEENLKARLVLDLEAEGNVRLDVT